MQGRPAISADHINRLTGQSVNRYTGGNRTMVAAATIVSMAAADGEHISIFPLMCPNEARCVSFSAPGIEFVKGIAW